jgi:nucleotide-binding universal stress UspA family protein
MAPQSTNGGHEIIVGVDGSPRAEDALNFAGWVAAVTGAKLALLAASAPGDWPSRSAKNALRAYANEMAFEEVAHIGGRVGRALPGSTAERLLHRAPCPVAVVPIDYRKRSQEHLRNIAVGYDGSHESRAALNAASEIARCVGAQLRVVRVFDAAWDATPALMATGHGYVAVHCRLETRAREDLEQLIAGLPDATLAEAAFPPGRPARELVAQLEGVDLIVVGTRGHGPLRAALSGGVSRVVVRDAACPVIVVPRGARARLSELFAQPSVLDAARPVGAHPALGAVGQGWTSRQRFTW